MHLVVAVVVACVACVSRYDPCDIPHERYADTATAIRAVLEKAPRPRVYAVGEYHPARGSRVPSPLARFVGEIIHLLDPRAHHLLLEAWLDAGCSFEGEPVGAQVAAAIGRTPATYADLGTLIGLARELDVETHGIQMSCIEHTAMLDRRGRVDFLLLLETITAKLHERARALAEGGKAIIVYGGALHNDLYPVRALASLSYAHALAHEIDGSVLELDLVVPEVALALPTVTREDWYPLLARATPGHAIVWQRAIDSYVVILPTTPMPVARRAP